MTSLVVRPRTSQTKFVPRKCHSHCWVSALLCILNSGKITIFEKCALQLRCIENCNAYTAQKKGPSSLVKRKAQVLRCPMALPTAASWNLNSLNYEDLPHSHHIPLASRYLFKPLDNSLQGKHFYNQQDAENLFQVFAESCNIEFLKNCSSVSLCVCVPVSVSMWVQCK